MISIIICSRTQALSPQLSQNIAETVGCLHELIVIDNSLNKFSIFEAYNLGMEKSKGAYLCFIHDDILFHTENWGKIVNRIFCENLQVGLLGIAGAKSKTKIPSAWWDCPAEHKYIYIKQHFKSGKIEDWNFGFTNSNVEEVVVIDGVFMVLKKDKDLFFDESIGRFHNYDLNISFESLKMGKKIVVTNQILIEHFSKGTINKDWVVSNNKVHKLYCSILPLAVNGDVQLQDLEILNLKRFLKQSLFFKEPFIAINFWFLLFLKDPFLKFHLTFWKNFIKSLTK